MNNYFEFSKVSKVYPTSKQPFVVLEEFDLQINQQEFVSIIGHSGCGKSTALMMAAGLNSITSGYIFLAGQQIVGPGPDRGIVFQSPSLLPWMSRIRIRRTCSSRTSGGRGSATGKWVSSIWMTSFTIRSRAYGA